MEFQSFIGPLSETELDRLSRVRASAVDGGFGTIEESDHELHQSLIEIDQIGQVCTPEGAAKLTLVAIEDVEEEWFVGLVNDGKKSGFTEVYQLPDGQFVKAMSNN